MTDKLLSEASIDDLLAALAERDNSPYTTKEVEPLLAEMIGWAELDWPGNTIPLRGKDVPVTCVEDFGGEGQGETRYVVVKIREQLFRKDGYYASHYGTDWDGDFNEVKPVEKTVIVYEPISKSR